MPDAFRGLAGNMTTVMLVLLVFYLYLFVRWQYVKRQLVLLLGVGGLAFALVGEFFTLGNATMIVWQIFTIIGNFIAFVCAAGATFGAKLPGVDESKLGGSVEQFRQPPKT